MFYTEGNWVNSSVCWCNGRLVTYLFEAHCHIYSLLKDSRQISKASPVSAVSPNVFAQHQVCLFIGWAAFLGSKHVLFAIEDDW